MILKPYLSCIRNPVSVLPRPRLGSVIPFVAFRPLGLDLSSVYVFFGRGRLLRSFVFHFYISAFGQAVVTGVVPSTSPVTCFQFLSRIGFTDHTARRVFIECC